MANKELSMSAMNGIFGEIGKHPEDVGKPVLVEKVEVDAAAGEPEGVRQRGRPKGSVKEGPARRTVTTRLTEEHCRKMGVICYYAHMTKQQLLDVAIERIIESYERENGPIREEETEEALSGAGVKF